MSDTLQTPIRTIGIIGGTGKEGKGLAYRWARAGYQVLIGSRTPEKAVAAAAEVNRLLATPGGVTGQSNLAAAQNADLVVLTVPFAVHQEMLEAIKPQVQGKILIDVTVPLVPPKVTRVQMPPAGSAAQEAQLILGEGVQVASAFQNISYEHLLQDEPVDCDVLVCGSGKAVRTTVLELVKAAGLIGWDAGPLENSAVVEGLTSILIGLNKQFGVLSSGIRITGISRGIMMTLTLTPLTGIPMVEPGDSLSEILTRALAASSIDLQNGDILVLAQKIVSKAENRFVNLTTITPSQRANELAIKTDKDPRFLELVLQESQEVMRTRPGTIIVQHRHGFICANAGIDHSNVQGLWGDPEDWVLLLPEDADRSAREIRARLEAHFSVRIGVLIIDSHGRAWRTGAVGVTIGLAGLPGLVDLRGEPDLLGYRLRVTQVAAADELAAAASLIMGQAAEATPVIHVRGFPYALREGGMAELIRAKELDMFR